MKHWHSQHAPQIELTQDEMLAISQEISQEHAPGEAGDVQELVLLPVDPYHMYVYWNLEEEKGKPSDLTLRVYWRPEEDQPTDTSKLWFDVALQGYHNQCQVQLPIDETAYSAELGWRDPDHGFTVVAGSNVIHVPRGRMAPEAMPETLAAEHDEQQSGITALKIPEALSGKAGEEYDQTRVDAHCRRALDKLQDNNSRKMPAGQREMPEAWRENHAEARIDAEIRQTLQEKGLADKLESLLVEGKQSVQSGKIYSEIEIDALIRRTLHDKGFDSDTQVLSNPQDVAAEKMHNAGINPSGQGNNRH